MFGLKPKTVHYWYKEEISDYRKDIAAGKWGEKDTSNRQDQWGGNKRKTGTIAKSRKFWQPHDH